MGEPGLVHVGMLTAEADSRAAHRAKGKRHTRLAPGHIADFSGVIDDLIHRHGHEVHHHDFGYGAHASYRSEEHTYELQSLMRNSYAVFCLKTKITKIHTT